MPEIQTEKELPQSEEFSKQVTAATPVNTETPKPEDPEEIENMSADDSGQSNQVTEEPKADKKHLFTMIVIVLMSFALGAVAGGLFIYRQNAANLNSLNEKRAIVSPQQTESSPSALPTEVPVDLTKFKIEILNGSDVKGVAGLLKDDLTKAGFDVSNTGNATNSAFIKTVLSTKKEINKDYLTKLQDLLLKSYQLNVDQDLAIDAKTDVLIIIGSE